MSAFLDQRRVGKPAAERGRYPEDSLPQDEKFDMAGHSCDITRAEEYGLAHAVAHLEGSGRLAEICHSYQNSWPLGHLGLSLMSRPL